MTFTRKGNVLTAELFAATPLFANDDASSTTLFPARGDSRLWLAGQANIIVQGRNTAPFATD